MKYPMQTDSRWTLKRVLQRALGTTAGGSGGGVAQLRLSYLFHLQASYLLTEGAYLFGGGKS